MSRNNGGIFHVLTNKSLDGHNEDGGACGGEWSEDRLRKLAQLKISRSALSRNVRPSTCDWAFDLWTHEKIHISPLIGWMTLVILLFDIQSNWLIKSTRDLGSPHEWDASQPAEQDCCITEQVYCNVQLSAINSATHFLTDATSSAVACQISNHNPNKKRISDRVSPTLSLAMA